jgi:hypothetical protein
VLLRNFVGWIGLIKAGPIQTRNEEHQMKRMMLKLVTVAVGLTLSLPVLAAEVDRRMHRQQERIVQGVKSGELTPRETARLERKEARIQREINRDRAANGGHLTPAEKAKINRQQNRVSREIYREKHDADAMPK